MKTITSKALANLMRVMFKGNHMIPFAYRHVLLGKVEGLLADLNVLTWDEMLEIEYSL